MITNRYNGIDGAVLSAMSIRSFHISALVSLLVCCSLITSSVYASEACEITQIESNGLSERSRIVEFPDGHTITIIGHNHGDREYPLKFSALTRASKEEVSSEQFTVRVRELLEDGRKSVKDANEDLGYLRSLLQMNRDIKFIGYEGTQRAADENYEWMVGLQNRYYSQVWGRDLSPSSDHKNAILLAAGAPMYLKMTEPGLYRNRSIVGLESDSAASIYDISLEEFDAARDELKALAKGDKEFLGKISDTYGELMALYSIYEPSKHDELVLVAARKNIPEKYMEAGMKWIRAGLEEMTAMKGRDRAIVDNMISINESGVLFLGLWHLDSIANMVQQKCLESNSHAPGTSSLTGNHSSNAVR